MRQSRVPINVRRMIPALAGAVCLLPILGVLLSLRPTWLILSLALYMVLAVGIGALVATTSRRIPSAFDTTADEFRIRDHPGRTTEFRLGLVSGLCALLAAGVLSIFWQSF
ncbi:hypothetical protein CBQ26_13750 [Deinococcus indicus]|uniref:Uncharacterized protein n=2 Tax=Deinococcus indicus TaxID=223556 RepID=A0A246BJN4_9DEIO|nr:hypothetical protein CBQ26_13750 [Deinococcus indicus]